MSLDGALLKYIREELSALVGARVDKIFQPSREEIIIALRVLGSADRGAKKLIFSANGSSARVCLTNAELENPPAPPMFCMLLRKHLGGGRLAAIRQDGLERILYFDFECVNEIGDSVINTLCAEIMGRHSNIILVRNGRVVDSIKRVTDEVSGVRRVLPNIVYETPPRPERANFFETEADGVLKLLEEHKNERIAKALPAVLEGISPIFARECAFYSAGDADAVCGELDGEGKKRLRDFFERAKSFPEFTAVVDETGARKDISFVDIKQYGGSFRTERFESANALADAFFTVKNDGAGQRSKELQKLLAGRCERVSRKLELQKKELADCAEREDLKIIGDLINANIYRLEKGMTSVVLEDFYSGGERRIKLSERLTPAQNAQKYYADYRKLCTAEKKLTELIAQGKAELEYLDSVMDSVMRAENGEELAEIRRELAEQGYIKAPRGERSPKKQPKLSEPLRFRSSDGFLILVGKNNRQNDMLTLKTAKASDIWLHTQNIAGSHVIIKTDGKEVPERTLTEAAVLAAFYSKARSGSGVPVDHTAVKFVKKPAGARPGMVIFTNNRTLFVTPEEEAVKKLEAGKNPG